MPRKSAIPPYRLHKASGQAVVHLDGRDHYLGVHGAPESKAKYQEIVRKALAEKIKIEMESAVQLHVDITVAELSVRYLTHVESYYQKDGRATSQVVLIKLALAVLLAKFSHLEVKHFGPIALRECQESMVKQGLARTEVNRRVRLIRQMFRWGVAWELVASSVLQSLEALSGLRRGCTAAPDRKAVRPIHESQVEAVIPFVAKAVAAMIRLQWWTAMRPNEVVQMRTCDLNTSGTTWEYRPEHNKLEHLGVERPIQIGPRARAVLKPWLRTDLEAYLFSPAEAEAEHFARRRESRKTPLWKSHAERLVKEKNARGRRSFRDHYSTASYRRAIHRACDLAQIDRWSPNRLRHSAATRIRREKDIETSRAVCGHSDADMTPVYAERDAAIARMAMEELG